MKKLITIIILTLTLSCKTYNTLIYIEEKATQDTLIITKRFRPEEYNRFDRDFEVADSLFDVIEHTQKRF